MKARKSFIIALGATIAIAAFVLLSGCDTSGRSAPESRTGVKATTADINVGADGLTVEQRNIKARLEADNQPGSIKHLYVISSMSGQTILYSTVKGKVTSSSKRLSPYSVTAIGGQYVDDDMEGVPVRIGGRSHHTTEVLQDDGTYGSSIPYVYWWDSRGVFHQHYIAGGQIVHVSDKPMRVKNIIINIESLAPESATTEEK